MKPLVGLIPTRWFDIGCLVDDATASARCTARHHDERHLDAHRTEGELWSGAVAPRRDRAPHRGGHRTPGRRNALADRIRIAEHHLERGRL